MRVFIDKGWLIQSQEIANEDGNVVRDKNGEPYFALLEFQVFDENGEPSSISYHGEAYVDPPRIVLGDPQRATRISEGTVARQATSESWNHYAGYKLAITSKRPLTAKQEMKALATAPQAYIDGYRLGVSDRKSRGIRRG